MEKINELLEKLDYKLPVSLSKRYDKLKSLFIDYKKQEKEHLDNPNDVDSKNALEEIIEYYNEECEDLSKDLNQLILKREQDYKKAEAKAKEEQEAKAKEEQEAKAKEEQEAKAKEEEEEKSNSGIGVFGLIFGAVLLAGSLGAINYFSKRK